jgi:hypothetical protein
VLAYSDCIALVWSCDSDLSVPVPAIGTGSNLLGNPGSFFPCHGVLPTFFLYALTLYDACAATSACRRIKWRRWHVTTARPTAVAHA